MGKWHWAIKRDSLADLEQLHVEITGETGIFERTLARSGHGLLAGSSTDQFGPERSVAPTATNASSTSPTRSIWRSRTCTLLLAC